MSKDNDRPNGAGSDVLLERVALGEASDEERRRLEERLAERGECLDERLAELRESNEAILDAYPAEMMAARIDARLDERRKSRERDARRPSRGGWFAGLGVLATAAVAAFLMFALPAEQTTSPVVDTGETVRLKGAEPSLVVWRKSSAEPERLEAGAAARAGDVLQLEYNAAGATYGVIASIDGRGVVTLHHPTSPEGSTKLDTGVVALDHSYRLDDAPDYERFFFVTSDKPIEADSVASSLEALASSQAGRSGQPDLPQHTHSTDFTVEKRQ